MGQFEKTDLFMRFNTLMFFSEYLLYTYIYIHIYIYISNTPYDTDWSDDDNKRNHDDSKNTDMQCATGELKAFQHGMNAQGIQSVRLAYDLTHSWWRCIFIAHLHVKIGYRFNKFLSIKERPNSRAKVSLPRVASST